MLNKNSPIKNNLKEVGGENAGGSKKPRGANYRSILLPKAFFLLLFSGLLFPITLPLIFSEDTLSGKNQAPSSDPLKNDQPWLHPESVYTPKHLYLQALSHNRDLIKLRIESNQAELISSQAKASRYPQIDFEASFSYLTNPLERISLTAGQLGAYPMPGGGSVLIPPQDTVIYKGMEKTMYQFKVTALQPIFTWGKIPLAIDLSRISIQSKNLQREKKEREILTQISILTYSLGMLEKIQEILNLQQKVAVRLLEISSESYESGFLIYADFLDAKIKAKQIDVALAELAEQKNQLVLQLRYITGIEELSSNQILLPVELIMPENLPGPDKDHLISSAKRNNPDLKLLSLLREAQDLKVRLTKAKGLLKPDLGLHLELSYSGSRFPFLETDWYGQGRYNLTSSLGIKTSLYDGGVKKAQIMEESQNLESVLLQIQEGFAALEQFISKTILSLDYQRINLEYQKLRIENSQHQLDLKKTQFQSGSGMETDYLNSQIALYGNIAEYYRNAISYYINYAELANAAGFEDPVIPKGEIK